MSFTFWTNSIWYILLGVISLLELVIVIKKTKGRGLIVAFFLTIFGITLILETIVLIFFKGYEYYPIIIKTSPNPFNDILAGNLFSQFSVSASVLLVIALNMKHYWYLVFAVIYGAIEELFLAIGIYKHIWYRTWMTVTMFPLGFWLAEKIYSNLQSRVKPVLYYGYIFLALFPLYVITILWGLQIFGYMDFSTTILRDPINSRYFLTLIIFFIPPSILMMHIYFQRPKLHWRALDIAMLYALYYTCYMLHLVWIKEGWFLIVSTVTIIWMYLSILLIDRLYGEQQKKFKSMDF